LREEKQSNMTTKDSNCPECDFPLDDNGDCTNAECETNLISEDVYTYDDPFYDDDIDAEEIDDSNEEQEPKID